jgi:hypothetical protein
VGDERRLDVQQIEAAASERLLQRQDFSRPQDPVLRIEKQIARLRRKVAMEVDTPLTRGKYTSESIRMFMRSDPNSTDSNPDPWKIATEAHGKTRNSL